jgi:plastocyanin
MKHVTSIAYRLLPAFAAGLLATSAWAGAIVVQVTDAAGQPVPDAIVYAEAEGGGALPKPTRGAEIEQKARKFMPLVTVVQTGTVITFPNYDTVRHHIYSFSPAKKFDQKLYSGVAAAPVTFDKAGTVVLGCNIHDKMVAYVLIVDTQYFGKADAGGKVRIDNLPAGKYQLKAWHYGQAGQEPAPQTIAMKGADMTAAFRIALKPSVAEDKAARPAGY